MKVDGRLVSVILATGVACSPGPDSSVPATQWVGTITTEGNVTTVVNESGSVWGGTATLVEELSIGVELGEEAYMFGSVADVWATDDRVYVADSLAPAVRVYDLEGRYLEDVGGEGQGPGEFQRPGDLLVSQAGLLYVRDSGMGGPINVYTQGGEAVDVLRGDSLFSSAWPMVMTPDGTLYTPARERGTDDAFEQAMGVAGPDGIVGEPVRVATLGFEPQLVRVNERASLNLPFATRHLWAMSPSGAIVVGTTDAYEFEIHAPDGQVTVVRRPSVSREGVDPDEAEWRRRATVRSGRRYLEDWSWDGAEIPGFKPAYTGLNVDEGGRIWVIRREPSRRVEDCDENPLRVTNGRVRPCWEYGLAFDAFEAEGRFLGSVDMPTAVRSFYGAYVRGEIFYFPIEDDAGTISVKRYRLVLPGEEDR